MKKTNRIIPNKRSSSAVIIIMIAGAITLFLLKNSIYDNKNHTVTDSQSHQSAAGQSATPPPAPPSKSTDTDNTAPSSSATETPSTIPPSPAAEASRADLSCQQVADDIQNFLSHLEQQEYMKAYDLDRPLPTYLNNILTKALDNPPVNDKETTDLLSVLKNASHFYRTLGIKDLSLVKEILQRESSSIEELLASLFIFSTQGDKCRANSTIKFQLPLTKSYEYAAFFLNTLGGQSYLARRDSTVRVLIRYYSILIIHQAAQQAMNHYHINLPYHLEAMRKEIEDMASLENQALYLDTLQKIKTASGKRSSRPVVPAN